MHKLVRSQRKPRRSRLLRLLKYTLYTSLFGAALFGFTLLYLSQSGLPPADSAKNSQLIDLKGQAVTVFSSSERNRQPVGLNEISPWLIKATLAVEDRKFYDHFGFDIKGMLRAMFVNLKEMDKVQGASTLSQQLARNLYLSHERTWSRKLKEAKLTTQLEMKYSKDEILNMYLNEIYYGRGAYGIEAASQMYFGKPAKELGLAESAILAGIPKGPTYYSPYNHMKNAKDRQKIVLSAMVQTGSITQKQADEAYNRLLSFNSPQQRTRTDAAPYFRDYIRNIVVHDLGFEESLLEHGGLRIYTTLDMDAQRAAEAAVASELQNSPDLEAALVSIDPRNGYVKALVGGVNYGTSQYNHVFATTRQPGSSFKPIMYLTALASKKMTPVSTFNSQPTLFHYDDNRKTYSPKNYGDKYLGEIDMRKAIAASDNIYAVNTILTVGADQVIELGKKMGITSPMEAVPSLALGTSPVSPFEMATVFSVISNQGQKVTPIAVLKITDEEGHTLYKAPQAKEQEQVIEPAAAYVLTQLMESVFEIGGTGNRVSAEIKRPVAGKTGTTSTDAWLVGFTPELSTAVWVGYDKGKTLGTAESRKAAPIFANFMEKALEKVPPKIFPMPSGVVSVYIDSATGKLATADCPDKKLEVFVQGTEPTEFCTAHGEQPAEPLPVEEKPESHSWWSDLKRWWME
ncbi:MULTISPECIES: transglycosylase domain-containing protein [Paenibacillus]|uniref:Penicillin-binding protein n=1 Tax=Paenibacillus vini TaxID=1476024 RepID=A0ABQ4MJN5_9BACL|nr:PBP1A family penicillin-binding protein [Paenibacillus vini]MDN4070823.1 PBP1A family penicillin-binding protein [Paenibacillus vini]GIP55630.1 penicillin-binding protein [Paenibacillus vini]